MQVGAEGDYTVALHAAEYAVVDFDGDVVDLCVAAEGGGGRGEEGAEELHWEGNFGDKVV
jgi:hypothetical protein